MSDMHGKPAADATKTAPKRDDNGPKKPGDVPAGNPLTSGENERVDKRPRPASN